MAGQLAGRRLAGHLGHVLSHQLMCQRTSRALPRDPLHSTFSPRAGCWGTPAGINPMSSCLQVPVGTDFSLQNIPFGVGRCRSSKAISVYTRVGDTLIDLSKLQAAGQLQFLPAGCLQQTSLNSFMSLGRPAWASTRKCIQHLVTDSSSTLASDKDLRSATTVDAVGLLAHSTLFQQDLKPVR